MYSWTAYRSRIQRFPVLRLVLMSAVLLLLLALPLLQGPQLWTAPVGVAVGLALALALGSFLRSQRAHSVRALRVLGFALMGMGLLRGVLPDPPLIAIVGGCAALWMGMWWTLLSEPIGRVTDGSDRYP